MRTVIIGAPASFRVLTPADLPVDLSLRHSFWRWVDFSGFDLSAYDMRDMDILDCNGTASKLGLGKTAMLMSRRTTWTNAVLPADISSYNHDFVIEVYNKALLGTLTNSIRASVTLMRNYVQGGYARSWQDAIQQLVNSGLSVAQMRTRFTLVFSPYPKILSRMEQHLTTKLWRPTAPNWRREKIEVEGLIINVAGHISGSDRWALARMLEQLILAERGVQIKCHFLQLDPFPVLRAIDQTDPQWEDPLWWLRFVD